jgi:hypothetical protein
MVEYDRVMRNAESLYHGHRCPAAKAETAELAHVGHVFVVKASAVQ